MADRPIKRRQFLQATAAGTLALGAAGSLLVESRAVLAEDTKQSDAIGRITQLAARSAIAGYRWADRGKSPPGYVKGMAVSFAKLYHELGAGNVYAAEMAKAATNDASKDAMKHYESIFQQAGMDNSKDGPDTLRHLFVLMLGLGMRESSGKYCEGRDRAAKNTAADTAEAGLFQTSFNARVASPLLSKLFNDFGANPTPSYLEVFKESVRCSEANLENFGDGEGQAFQKLTKQCPFFAVQFAGIGLRHVRRHWGPINRRAAEVRADADAMFKDVQKLVDQDKLGPLL